MSPTTSCRRSAVGLDYDDDDWADDRGARPLALRSPAVRRQRRPAALPHALRARRRAPTGGATGVDARRRLLPGRRLARRRLPRRPRGLLLPPHASTSPSLARLGDRARPGRRGGLPAASATARRSATITGVFQHWDCIDPTWNPGGLWRPVRVETTGPVRIDRLRVLCRDANDDARPPAAARAELDSDAARTVRVRTTVDGELLEQRASSPLAGGLNEVEWTLDVDDPRLWWPWSLGDAAADRRRRSRCSSTTSVSDTRHACAPGCARSALQRLGASRSTASALFVKGANLAPDPHGARRGDARRAAPRRRAGPRGRASTSCGCTATSPGPSSTTPPTSSACCCGRTSRCSGATPARSASRPCARRARRSTCSATTRRSPCGAAHNEPVALDLDRRRRSARPSLQYVAGQQLPTWNKTVLDRWVKRAFEQADETRPVIAHSGVLPHLPQLDGTDSHLYFGWYHGDERDLPGFAAPMPRMVRFVSEFGAQAVPDDRRVHGARALARPRLGAPAASATASRRHVFDAVRAARRLRRRSTSGAQATQRVPGHVLRHHIETLRRLKYRPTGGFCLVHVQRRRPRRCRGACSTTSGIPSWPTRPSSTPAGR